jgi:drug/metabolite transporter (DMT)-like permease
MVFWSANFIVVKAATHQIPPISFALLRFSLAAGLLLLALRLREGSIGLPRRDAIAVIGLGAIGFGAYQVMWATALQSIPAGDSALLIAATPVFTALLAVVSGADSLSRLKFVGGIVSFVGVALVIAAGPGLGLGFGGSGASGAVVAGDVLTLAAAMCWSVYTAFGSPILRRHSPLRTTAWAMVGGSLVLLLPGLWQASSGAWSSVEAPAWLGLLYSALIPAGLSNVVIFHAIRLLGPTRVTNFQFLVPFIAVVLGAIFLAERIRPEQIAGGAIIVLGVSVTRASRRPEVVTWLRDRLPL